MENGNEVFTHPFDQGCLRKARVRGKGRATKMASSQVKVASSSPFGCVLRDRNQIDGCRESTVFQLKMKNFIKDHLNMSADSKASEKNNNFFEASKKNNTGSLRFMRSNQNSNKDKHESCFASLISPKHSRLLDRWAARQAREMVSNLEDEAELLAMPNSNNNNSNNENTDMLLRTYSNSSFSDAYSETAALGASSLVQIWENRLNKSNGSKPNTQISSNASLEELNRGGSEAGESSDSSDDHEPLGIEEPFSEWESYRTAQSNQSSPQASFSSLESAESDRVSVADIVKRLTSIKQGQSPSHSIGEENGNKGRSTCVIFFPCIEHERGFSPELSANKAFIPQITCLPRIRGRRAFHDLLMHFVRDRYGELNNLAERGAVSKFTQRGRIQSVLRLRLLQRGVVASNKSHQKSTASEVNRKPQGSAIMQLRERFNSGVGNRTTMPIEVAEPRSPHIQFDASSTTNELSKDTCSLIVNNTTNHSPEFTQKSVSQTSVDGHNKEEARPCSNTTLQETCLEVEVQHTDSKETAEAIPSMTESNVNKMEDEVEISNQEYTMADTTYDETVDEEEEAINQHYAESDYGKIVEEVEDIDMNCDENSYDWISEISRPRSYWEERRQEWYREMLDTESHNEDICKLLERRTVSTFLSSDFRDRMDRLMQSHRGTQIHLVSRQDEDEDNQLFVSFLQEHLRPARNLPEDERERVEEQEEDEETRNEVEEEPEEDIEEEEEENVEEHEGERLISNSYHEVCDYLNQSSLPTQLITWSDNDNETGDDIHRAASISSPPSQSQSYCEESRRNFSSMNHHSIEMELIHDMRGHMEQLYREISELRKSMETCMDMQMQMQFQQCKNQQVQLVKNEEKKSHNMGPKKGNCCICYDMKVDALLYRCGHMCTCLNCANELQWNSGKCPICRAKIVDVVRVYVDF